LTDSRETMRRKAFKDRAPSADPSPLAVPLTTLCVIRACLNPRVGTNLCQHHTNELDNQ